MKTGFRGTFVISWAQTESDGRLGAAPELIETGTIWRWHGEALRVDGPQGVLRLAESAEEQELHRRAARKAYRLLGLPGDEVARARAEAALGLDDLLFPRGFEVTDGRAAYAVTLVEAGEGRARLAMFSGAVPPPATDLWVVRTRLDEAGRSRQIDQPTGVICFTPGTRIRTAEGDLPIERIREGDKVQTKDNGLQEVLWIGEKRISGARLYAMPELRPIRLRAGALGVDRPDEDLLVSPGHRMLVKGAPARALYNQDEVLVRATDLIDDRSVVRDHTLASVTYVHLLLPSHEVVFANGLETESFLPTGETLGSVDAVERARLTRLMPELAGDPSGYGESARRALSPAEAAILMAG